MIDELSFERCAESLFNPELESFITSLDWSVNSDFIRFTTSDFRRFFVVSKDGKWTIENFALQRMLIERDSRQKLDFIDKIWDTENCLLRNDTV